MWQTKPKYKAVNIDAIRAVEAAASVPVAGLPIYTAGLEKSDQAKLIKRARAKYFSFALAKELSQLDSPLQTSYFRSCACCSTITQTGNQLTAKYCGARWCLVCNRIRTAKLINKYTPHLEQMHEPHFVTLTIPNITGDVQELKYCIKQLQDFCRRTFDRLRKHKIKYKGFRKIEITYNVEENNYHPHIHFLLDGFITAGDDESNIKKIYQVWQCFGFGEKAFKNLLDRYNRNNISAGYFKCELLRRLWLEEFTHARAVAQDIRPARAGTLKELFKYSTKVITKTKRGDKFTWSEKKVKTRTGEIKTVKKKQFLEPATLAVHVGALDKIYIAIYGKRIIQPVGYTRKECAEFNDLASGEINEDLEAQTFEGLSEAPGPVSFVWRGNDWHETFSGGRLTGYKPTADDSRSVEAFVYDSG